MKTYTVDITAPGDEKIMMAILAALSKRNVIRLAVAAPWQPLLNDELEARIVTSGGQPHLSFADARQRLGL